MSKSVFRVLRSRWAAFAHDLLWVPLALFLSYWLRFNMGPIPEIYWSVAIMLLTVALPVQGIVFWHSGLYRGMWRFASIPDLIRILKAVGLGVSLTFLIVFVAERLEGVPRSILLLYPLLLTLGLSGPRMFYRWIKDRRFDLREKPVQRALIAGAGRAGEMLVRDLLKHGQYLAVGFVDDDPFKQGREIHGVRVVGKLAETAQLIDELDVDVVLIAIPSATQETMRQLVRICMEARVASRTLPTLAELADGRVEVSRLREIRIEDLLGRDPINLDDAGLHDFLDQKCILITGAGGSIGSELCRQILRYAPGMMILLDHSEYNLYRIDQEVHDHPNCGQILSLLGDVRDPDRMRWLFETYHPQIVFHAAAYKHVPIVEENPAEGIKTNILGTKQIADLASEYQAEKFVLVSTDKAVNPSNVMGASKRAAEIYCQNLNGRVNTRMITTRFGNVLDSTGSVVPLFRQQIASGGPVTVTHPDVSRFFMTIQEACQLILQAAAIGEGGEIFVLDMGSPVRIKDLAEQMISLSGLEPGRDIEIQLTGLRPGEKLHEELFYSFEVPSGTKHPKIMLAAAREYDWHGLQTLLARLQEAGRKRDVGMLHRTLKEIVPEFTDTFATQTDQSTASIH
jgi:FlaA1/EpsC-like NDP-sugar epimerase